MLVLDLEKILCKIEISEKNQRDLKQRLNDVISELSSVLIQSDEENESP